MICVNSKGVNSAYESLANKALIDAGTSETVAVNVSELRTLLMAFTILFNDKYSENETEDN